MSQRFNYIRYDESAAALQQTLKEQFEKIEETLYGLLESREKSLVLTRLEEAYMWTGKAIRNDQITRNSQTENIPERSNQ